MSLTVWIIVYAVTSLMCIWIVFLGGAEFLEDTLLVGFLTGIFFAPEFSAEKVKAIMAIGWFLESVWFVIGIISPEMRGYHQ